MVVALLLGSRRIAADPSSHRRQDVIVALERHERSFEARLEGREARGAPPVVGVGVGGFRRAYADLAHLKGKEPKAAASHTTPITVAAENGFPGLLLLLWLVGSALLVAFRRLGRGFDGDARLVFGLALTAILVHCVFYNALFEDPLFWGLLALVVVAGRAGVDEPRGQPA